MYKILYRYRWAARRQQFLQRELEADARDAALEKEEEFRSLPIEVQQELERKRLEDEQRRIQEDQERQRAERIAREREEEAKERERQAEAVVAANAASVAGHGSGFVVGRIMTFDERKKSIEKLVASIPADRQGLASWPIKWECLNEVCCNNIINSANV